MNKFIKDLSWSYFALGVMAISGLLINLMIGASFGAEALGVFNQSYAVYVIASQISVGGFHLAVFKYTVENCNHKNAVDLIVSSAFLLGLTQGVIWASLLFFLSVPIGESLESSNTSIFLGRMAPALILFNLNKILLSTLNALREMKDHSISLILRYFVLFSVVVYSVLIDDDILNASYGFLASEFILFFFLLLKVRGSVSLSFFNVRFKQLKLCWLFGMRGFWSGLMAEVNLRTDVLLVGYFLDDRITGVYSFVAILFEGFLNVIYSLRMNINPVLVEVVRDRDWRRLLELAFNVFKWVYPFTWIIFIVVLLLYVPFVEFLFDDDLFSDGYIPFVVLIFSLCLVAGVIPFEQMLLQGGWPGYYSIAVACAFTTNFLLNAIFIPFLGINGAAISSAFSLIVGVVVSFCFCKKLLSFKFSSIYKKIKID